MSRESTISELRIDHLFTENNVYTLDVLLMSYVKATSLVSLIIDDVEMLDMDNFLFANVGKVGVLRLSNVVLDNSSESVVGMMSTSHASLGFLRAEAVVEYGSFSHISAANLLMKGSLFFVCFEPNTPSDAGKLTVEDFTAVRTIQYFYDNTKPISLFSISS